MMRISSGYATPKDLVTLKESLEKIPAIQHIVATFQTQLLKQCHQDLIPLPKLTTLLTQALVDDPPVRISEGGIFRDGFYAPLDELKDVTRHGKQWLSSYQTDLKKQTGIKNLKVSFNKIFGYYIEVSKGQAHLMPQSFQKRQTLVNAERFISPILKEYESKVLTAQERIQKMEHDLFQQMRQQILTYEKSVLQIARAIAQIDTLISLAHAATTYDFCRPTIDMSHTLTLKEARHPVVELKNEQAIFIPNDTDLDGNHTRLMLITGPNMGGKSTYIRQVALCVILAQMGSFVPAQAAHIGIIDRIFTRIGANDDLSRGQSTFMVEMSETATILNNLTSRSLVILDEIGRGTSTYDGLSIAWAVVEHLLITQAKTLFATHYWELTDLENQQTGVVNYHARVQEQSEEVIFLHKIAKGKANRSYGIHVAKLAGIPLPVIQRANVILKKLETRKPKRKPIKKEPLEEQLTFF